MYYSVERRKFAHYFNNMKKYIIIISLLAGTFFTSCGEYNKVLKSTDYEYKYEAAKSFFGKGEYSKSATILEELITILKGSVHFKCISPFCMHLIYNSIVFIA